MRLARSVTVSVDKRRYTSGIFWKVGIELPPLLVRTCPADQTVPDCTAPVPVVPPNIGAYAVRVDTPVPPSATDTSVLPGA
jgi:hypothetical protein